MHWLMLTAGTKLFRSYRIFQSIWLLLLVVYAVVCSSTNRSSESGRETRMTLEIWADELSVRSNKNSRKMAQEERERKVHMKEKWVWVIANCIQPSFRRMNGGERGGILKVGVKGEEARELQHRKLIDCSRSLSETRPAVDREWNQIKTGSKIYWPCSWPLKWVLSQQLE